MSNYSDAAKRYINLNTHADKIKFIKETTHMNQDIFDDIIINIAIHDDLFIKESLDRLNCYPVSYLIKIYLPTRLSFDIEVVDFLCKKSIKECKFFPFMPFKAWFNNQLFTWQEKLDSYNKNVDIFRKISSRIPSVNLNSFRSGLLNKVDEIKSFIEILNRPIPEHLSIDSLNELAIEIAIADPEFLKNKEFRYRKMKDVLHVDFPNDDDLLKLACCNDDYIKHEQFEELLDKYGKSMISQIYLRSRIDFKFIGNL